MPLNTRIFVGIIPLVLGISVAAIGLWHLPEANPPVRVSETKNQTVLPPPEKLLSDHRFDIPSQESTLELASPHDARSHSQQASQGAPRASPPAALAGFWNWSAARQLDEISMLQAEVNLPADILAFFRAALVDNRLDAVTRNNLANALLNQEVPVPGLVEDFSRMVQDQSEPYGWREYALQHLAVALRLPHGASDGVPLLKKLMEEGELGIPGTAALQLHRLDTDGIIELDATYSAALRRLIGATQVDFLSRMTAISICGERRIADALPELRVLAQDPNPSLRRVAIAALGGIGQPNDEAIILTATSDKDPTVRTAARRALQSLKQEQEVRASTSPREEESPRPAAPAAHEPVENATPTDAVF